ncbi:MAG: hypothetical protein DI601_02235 [Azospirillum brasilense]|nr:MAG: hypothetical protein DI601_02235 [Azospirillum brasilense]
MTPPVWRWVDGPLEVDLDIEIDGDVYPLRLRYPDAFPACPPSVYPRDVQVRWSAHQYGAGGELCLEIGPDNWVPDITGASLVESAHRLLDAERPGSVLNPKDEVPSRHHLTASQELRGKDGRFLLTEDLSAYLAQQGDGAVLGMDVLRIGHGISRTALVTALRDQAGAEWRDTSIPSLVLAKNQYAWSGTAIRISDSLRLPPVTSAAALGGILAAIGVSVPEGGLSTGDYEFILLFGRDREPQLLWPLSPDGGVVAHDPVRAGDSGAGRLDPGYEHLSTRRVGIVGAGSVGSKVATSLARAGVGRFLLVDGDVLLPGNLVRHDLDWVSVGGHKVDELSWRLGAVRAGVQVTVRRTMLTGQEATASVAAALDDLASCDLIVEATADGTIFGLVGTHAAARRKAMVWAEVLEGGIGGLLARSRPGQEPTPLVMRSRILDWCRGMGAPWARTGSQYASMGEDGTPLIADDADVGVIAAHLARFAIDTLLERTPSDFPHAAYFVGLRRSWIFGEPFDTHPVDVGQPEERRPFEAVPPEVIQENLSFLSALLPDTSDAPDPSI